MGFGPFGSDGGRDGRRRRRRDIDFFFKFPGKFPFFKTPFFKVPFGKFPFHKGRPF